MSVLPRSLCSVDRSLHAIEEYPTQTVQNDQPHDIATTAHPPRVLIVDALAVLHSMKKTQQTRTTKYIHQTH